MFEEFIFSAIHVREQMDLVTLNAALPTKRSANNSDYKLQPMWNIKEAKKILKYEIRE